MNIKKIIPSQKIRHRIMRLGSFIPDSIMLRLQYWILLKRLPDLNNPTRFSEWTQVYKMRYRNPLMLDCVDKYAVREIVKGRIGKEYLTKLYQVCKLPDELRFEKLPDSFVIKTTSGGNGDNVLIVRDKSKIDINEAKAKIKRWLSKNYSDTSREWAYAKVAKNPLIIVEEYLENNPKDGLDDYKFLCYNGKFRYLWVDKGRYSIHRRGFWNENLEFIPNTKSDHLTFETDPGLPSNIDEMIKVAEKLAEGFPFVRVDFYDVAGRIVFGEMTFYPWSGYIRFTPDSFDAELGAHFPEISDGAWTRYLDDSKNT